MLNTMLEKSGGNWCHPLISEFGGTTVLFVHYRIVVWTIFTALRHVPLHLVSSGVLSWRDGDVNINKYTCQRGIYLNEDYSFKKWVNALPAFGLDYEGDWDTVWTDGRCAHQIVWVQIQDIKTQPGQEAKASVRLAEVLRSAWLLWPHDLWTLTWLQVLFQNPVFCIAFSGK